MDSIRKVKLINYINNFLGFQLYMAPILVLFYLEHIGINFQEFTMFEMIVFLSITVLEIPSGAFSEAIGKKKAIIFANITIVAAMSFLIFFPSIYSLIITAFLFPIGVSLNSGNLPAIMYEILKKNQKESEYLEIASKGHSINLLMAVIASAIGGYLANINIIIPVIIDTICIIGSTVSIYYFIDTPKEDHVKKINFKAVKEGYFNIINSIKEVKSNAYLFVTIGLASVIFAYTRSSYMTYQPLLESFKFNKADIGYFFSFFGVVSALFAYLNKRINHFFSGQNHMEYFFIFLVVISMGMAYYQSMVTLVMTILVQQVIRGLSPTFFSMSINNLIKEDNNRVTVLSIVNFMNSLFCTIFILCVGFLSEKFSYARSLFGVSLFTLIILLIFSFLRRERGCDE